MQGHFWIKKYTIRVRIFNYDWNDSILIVNPGNHLNFRDEESCVVIWFFTKTFWVFTDNACVYRAVFRTSFKKSCLVKSSFKVSVRQIFFFRFFLLVHYNQIVIFIVALQMIWKPLLLLPVVRCRCASFIDIASSSCSHPLPADTYHVFRFGNHTGRMFNVIIEYQVSVEYLSTIPDIEEINDCERKYHASIPFLRRTLFIQSPLRAVERYNLSPELLWMPWQVNDFMMKELDVEGFTSFVRTTMYTGPRIILEWPGQW